MQNTAANFEPGGVQQCWPAALAAVRDAQPYTPVSAQRRLAVGRVLLPMQVARLQAIRGRSNARAVAAAASNVAAMI